MGSESYWLDTAPAFTGAQLGALPGQVDVAIVGGGFTGLAAARQQLLDQRRWKDFGSDDKTAHRHDPPPIPSQVTVLTSARGQQHLTGVQ